MSAERLLLLPLLAISGCGGLVGGDYRGEVLLEIEGAVLMDSDLVFDSDIGVALLWTNDDEAAIGAQSVVVQTSFPARYTIQIHSTPRDQTRLALLGVDALQASIGQIVLYQDLDGDGAWAGPGREPVVGGAYDTAVVWIPSPDDGRLNGEDAAPVDFGPDDYLPEIDHWTPRGGFQLVEVPIPPACGLPLSQIFFERTDNRATLHVGGLRNAYYDWDCDGTGDYTTAQPDAVPPDDPEQPGDAPPNDDGFLGFDLGQCGPEEVMLEDCDFLAEQLASAPQGDPYALPPYLFPPEWLECLEPLCYEVVEEYRIASEGSADLFEP